MNNKCEWDKGEFYPCSEGAVAIPNGEIQWKVPIAGSEERWIMREFHYCPFCGADIRKPVEIKEGMFGKFSCTVTKDTEWGILQRCDPCGGIYQYSPNTEGGGWYNKFIPGLPEGFNQDGTPKENEDE